MTTLDDFRRAWYLKHASHNPDYERDRLKWRATVITARTWQQAANRSEGNWQVAAINHCLPREL